MPLITIFFSFQSIVFLIGIYFLSKKIVVNFDLNKNLKISIFSILILIISFCFHFLYLENFYYLKELSQIIYYIFIFFGYYSIIIKFTKLFYKDLKKFNYLNIIFFLILINILFSSLVPVTDADSIRYHLGQFNNYQKFTEYDLHSKISYIGDGLNIISYYSNSFNIISCLNLYFIFLIISLIKKTFSNENKNIFILFFLSVPIYLNLIISQKPYLWLVFNLFYIFFLIHKKYVKKDTINLSIILINLSLIQISKPEFLIIIPVFVIYLIFVLYFNSVFSFEKNVKKIFSFIISILFFPLIFFIYNYLNYSDPTKILIIQNNIAEEKFLDFLQNSNNSLSFSNIFEFFLSLGLPLKYINYFSISLGFGFFVCIIFSKFRLKKEYLFVFFLILINLIFLRINIEDHHSRNYILIFFILIYLLLQEKIFYKNLIKTVLILQLFITQTGFFYFNYEIYLKNNYDKLAYNYNNEKIISKLVKDQNYLVVTDIDGNLFKKYNYVNIDYFNFDKSFFYSSFKNKIKNNDDIDLVILIFKIQDNFLKLDKFLIKEIKLISNTRNPLKSDITENYGVYKVPKKLLIDIIENEL